MSQVFALKATAPRGETKPTLRPAGLSLASRLPEDRRLRALMVGYQAGDLAAFDELYTLLVPTVRGVLRRQNRGVEPLEDLVQESFLQMHRARHTYDPAYALTPWVAAIARHVGLMHYRAASRRPQPTETVDDLTIGVRGTVESYAEQADVRAALAALSPERRRPVVWHHLVGLSFREIAQRLGIREDAAKLRSSRGMADLRRRLTPDEQRDA